MHQSTREIRLAEALVESADTLVEEFEAAHHLSRVADHCVRLLPARAAGIMLIDDLPRARFWTEFRHGGADLVEALFAVREVGARDRGRVREFRAVSG